MADAYQVNITVEDNSATLKEAEGEAIERALYAMGTKALEGAIRSISGQYKRENLAVKTGRLRASLSFITPRGDMTNAPPSLPKANNSAVAESKSTDKLKGMAEARTVIIGTNVEYAYKVHNGMWTSEAGGVNKKYKVRPFLREGIDNTKGQIKSMVERIFKGEL